MKKPRERAKLLDDSLDMMLLPHLPKDESKEGNKFSNPPQTLHSEHSCCDSLEHGHAPLEGQVIDKPFSMGHTPPFQPCKSVHGAVASCTLQDSEISDVETPSTNLEHVSLRFKGSNCPGCTSKISNALHLVPAVHNLRINNILLQADLDLDVAKTSTRDLIEAIQRTTGRLCQRIGDGWQEIDLLIPNVNSQALDVILPLGVKDVMELGRDTFCVKYDAKIIGARQLLKSLSKNLDGPVTLAPRKCVRQVPTDVRTSAYKASLSAALTAPILVLAWAPLPERQLTYAAVSLALATVIQAVVVGPFYARAFRSLVLSRRIDMDVLIVLSTSTTYGFSLAAFVCEVSGTDWSSQVYFETGALLISFIMLGRLMSDLACYRSVELNSVKTLQSHYALLIDETTLQSDTESEVDARLLQYGDCFKVKLGRSVVTDGVIVSGASEFDEGVVTGEARLVERVAGSQVIAGSVNHGETVVVQLIRLPGQNTIDDIAAVVEEMTRSKPKSQQIADRVAGWVVPAIAALALVTLGIWFAVGALLQKQPPGLAISNAVPYAISVLVVTCPCALGLAVPIVLIIASKVGIKHGIAFKSADALNAAKDITHVVFDKTGTLTESRLSVVCEEYYFRSRSLSAALVLALTNQSKHPVSSAVAEHLRSFGIEPAHVTNFTSIVGNGLEGMWNGQAVRVGNARWLGVDTLSPVQSLLSKDLTVLCVVQGSQLIALFGLEASLRNDASSVVLKLVERGIAVSILSGDEIGPVQKVATELNIPYEQAKARCNPLEKQQYIKELMRARENNVLFCGDGINDSAALAQASFGLQMHNDMGIAQNTADAVLMNFSLSSLLILVDLAKHAHRQIVFNFIWAAFYNVFAILLAAGAFVKFRLPPEYAGLGEAVSVLPVIVVPLHLHWRKYA